MYFLILFLWCGRIVKCDRNKNILTPALTKYINYNIIQCICTLPPVVMAHRCNLKNLYEVEGGTIFDFNTTSDYVDRAFSIKTFCL